MKNEIKFLLCAVLLATFCFSARAFSFDVLEGAQVHGFVGQGYLYTGDNEFLADTKKGSFEFNEVGVNFTARPLDRLRIGIQLFSRDLGDTDNNRVDIDWAYADYRFMDELGVRVGRFKIPNGLFMDSMDLDMSRTTIFLPIAVYEPRFRAVMYNGNGVALYGAVDIGFLGDFDYVSFVESNSFPKEAMENEFNNYMEVESMDLKLAYGGRIIWNTPLEGLLLSGTYVNFEGWRIVGEASPEMTAPIPELGGMSLYPPGTKMTFDDKSGFFYYLSTQYTKRKFVFTAEYYVLWSRISLRTDKPYDPFVASLIGFKGLTYDNTKNAGWYTQTDYQFFDWLTAALTYSVFYYDLTDPHGHNVEPNFTGYQNDATVSLRFDITSHWNIKLETHFMTGAALVITADRGKLPDNLEKNWNLYAVKTSFYF